MTQPPAERSPIAIALEWSTTIMVIAAEMVLPALAGYWLDKKLGTRAVFLLIGVLLGGLLATVALMRVVQARANRP